MSDITQFALTLMDHVRNDAKTPLDSVQSALGAWKQKEEGNTQAKYEAHEEYMNKHEKPRMEREAAYLNYLQEKMIAYNSIEKAPTAMRKQMIAQWLRIPLPELIKDGVSTDLIYTSSR